MGAREVEGDGWPGLPYDSLYELIKALEKLRLVSFKRRVNH